MRSDLLFLIGLSIYFSIFALEPASAKAPAAEQNCHACRVIHDTIKPDITTLKAQITGLRADLATLQSSLAALQARKISIKTRVVTSSSGEGGAAHPNSGSLVAVECAPNEVLVGSGWNSGQSDVIIALSPNTEGAPGYAAPLKLPENKDELIGVGSRSQAPKIFAICAKIDVQ